MKIKIPASKSITIRALLLAALADGNSQLNNILVSEDTLVFIKALKSLGVKIKIDKKQNKAFVQGCSGQFPINDVAFNCCNSGLTARFLLAACATQPGVYRFDGIMRMRQRPMQALIAILKKQGCQFMPEGVQSFPLTMIVPQVSSYEEIIEIDAKHSSQFASALLMLAPFAEKPARIKLKNLVSRPYIDMTINVMQQFGVEVKKKLADELFVKNKQTYQACEYTIEPDCSTASYFFALAALMKKEIIVENIDRQYCLQGDIAFLNVLEAMGCCVEQRSEGIKVIGPKQLSGISVDMNAFSDTFMTLAAIAPFAKTPTTITNIAHTRLKESDRISAMATELKKLNVKVDEGNDWLRVYPSFPKANIVDSHNDHRIAMSLAILGLKVQGIKIKNKDCIKKTCPSFFELLQAS